MLMTFTEVSKKIDEGNTLHIAGTESLLRKLPKGNWIGGSTEYFMSADGGKVSDGLLFVTEFPYEKITIKTYSTQNIKNVAKDASDNGFSIIIIPFDSTINKEYAENASEFDEMFMKNTAGWVSGGQTPLCVNGTVSEIYTDKAVALHVEVPQSKMVTLNIVNIFEQDETSPIIEFAEEGFAVKNCIVDGKEMLLADYLAQNKIDVKMPLVGNYSGTGINVSFKEIEGDTVYFYAPVFNNIKYRIAKSISNYEEAFQNRLKNISDKGTAFTCNCILNFLYGGLEGKNLGMFAGPITFGEIAHQLVNQTLVYVVVTDK